jgi:hypothetical protein
MEEDDPYQNHHAIPVLETLLELLKELKQLRPNGSGGDPRDELVYKAIGGTLAEVVEEAKQCGAPVPWPVGGMVRSRSCLLQVPGGVGTQEEPVRPFLQCGRWTLIWLLSDMLSTGGRRKMRAVSRPVPASALADL